MRRGAPDKSYRLLRTPTPLPDESLEGYILRLSEANYYDSPNWITNLIYLSPNDLSIGWRSSKSPYFQLSILTDLPLEDINKMRHLAIHDANGESIDAQWQMPFNLIRFSRPKICSDCFRDIAYCKKFWDISTITLCPIHKTLLVDICPSCKQRINWRRKCIYKCNCGKDLRKIKMPEIPASRSKAFYRLMRSFDLPGNKPISTPAPLPDLLSFGDLSRLLACLAKFIPDIPYKIDISKAENYLCWQAIEQACSVLDDWPDTLHRFYDNDKYSRLLNPFNPFIKEFNNIAKHPPLAFLHIAIEEHRIESAKTAKAPNDYLIRRRFQSIDEIQQKLGLTAKTFNDILSNQKIKFLCSVSNPEIILLDTDLIYELMFEQQKVIDIKYAAYKLKISSYDLYDLIEAGYLSLITNCELFKLPNDLLEFELVIDLYKEIEKHCVPKVKTETISNSIDSEFISFDEIRHVLYMKNIGLRKWLKAIFDGELKPFLDNSFLGCSDDIQFSRFKFLKEQVQTLLEKNCQWTNFKNKQKRRRELLSKTTQALKQVWDSRKAQVNPNGIKICNKNVIVLQCAAINIFKRHNKQPMYGDSA